MTPKNDKKKVEGWTDKRGIEWVSKGYLYSKEVIAKDKGYKKALEDVKSIMLRLGRISNKEIRMEAIRMHTIWGGDSLREFCDKQLIKKENIVFTPKQLLQRLKTAQKGDIILFDEIGTKGGKE